MQWKARSWRVWGQWKGAAGEGCCISKDGTLVITAAERAFVPVAYLRDEIIPKPERSLCVPLLALNLKMQGHTMRKRRKTHTATDKDTRRPRGFLSKKRCIETTPSCWAAYMFPTARGVLICSRQHVLISEAAVKCCFCTKIFIPYSYLTAQHPSLIMWTNRQTHT